MDLSKFKTSDWLIVGGGIGMLIGGFLNWVSIEVGGFSVDSGNAFDFFWTGTIPWLLLIGSAVITALVVMDTLKKDQAPWTMIVLAATALAALLLLIRVVFNPIDGSDIPGIDVGRGIGMYVSFLAGVAAVAGAFMNFQAAGGELSDLTDMDKLKESFGGGDDADSGDSAPPPPPPPTQ